MGLACAVCHLSPILSLCLKVRAAYLCFYHWLWTIGVYLAPNDHLLPNFTKWCRDEVRHSGYKRYRCVEADLEVLEYGIGIKLNRYGVLILTSILGILLHQWVNR